MEVACLQSCQVLPLFGSIKLAHQDVHPLQDVHKLMAVPMMRIKSMRTMSTSMMLLVLIMTKRRGRRVRLSTCFLPVKSFSSRGDFSFATTTQSASLTPESAVCSATILAPRERAVSSNPITYQGSGSRIKDQGSSSPSTLLYPVSLYLGSETDDHDRWQKSKYQYRDLTKASLSPPAQPRKAPQQDSSSSPPPWLQSHLASFLKLLS